MNDLTGFPDFQTPTSTADLLMYAPFGKGSYSVLPRQLIVAQDASERPKFDLALIKRSDDLGAGGQYAVLDLALAGDFSIDDALTAARAEAADATVKPISINSGFARLYPTSGTVTLPTDMTAPIPLGWSGPDFARWTMRLSIGAGELIKETLFGSTLLFGARVEFDAIGVSPRLSATVEFDPAQLIGALLAGNPTRQIADRDLLAILRGPLSGLPLKIIGTLAGADAERFPQAMADRVAAAYGSLAPAPMPLDHPYIAIRDLGPLDGGTVRWDLSEAVAVPRQWAMMLDPLVSLRAVADDRIAALVKEITIPALDLGFCNIDVAANLPPNRIGVPAIGVNIEFPPNPPNRPNAINQTVTFTPPDDGGSVKIRLSPDEALSYTVTCFAVVMVGSSVHQYESPPRTLTTTWLQLQARDFPITFVHLTAADRLLRLADVTGTLRYAIDGKTLQQPLKLSAAAPDAALVVPNTATGAKIALIVVPSSGGPGLGLPPMAPGRIRLDMTSFREYGPHTFKILCDFGTGTGPLTIDLLPEEKAGDPTAIATVNLIPSQPGETWGYTTSSPFLSGYRYRKSGEIPGPWSPLLSPFAPLTLKEDGGMVTASGSDCI
jgi:hypothetical protein